MQAQTVIRPLLESILRYLEPIKIGDVPGACSTIARQLTGPILSVEPREVGACRYLDGALAVTRNKELASAIAAALPYLRWGTYDGYALEQIGPRFVQNHAYTILIGDGGFIDAADFDLGLFVIAPKVFYRDHHHAAPELYAPLTGPHGWRFRPDGPIVWKDADVPVWNEPWASHATLVGDVPFLALYCWTRDVQPVAQVIPATDWDQLENGSQGRL